jgi:4'-phosphopantetheinyl transferase
MNHSQYANTRAPGDIHLWRIVIKDFDPGTKDVLSPEEHQRATRFRFEKDRREFVSTRSILRHLLGAYTGQRPEAMQFYRGERGKPAVDGNIQFNVSHAGGVALIAISESCVGVDVERVVSDFPWEPIARNFFPEKERDWISALPYSSRALGFFRCWTRREAYVKALGTGVPTESACGLSAVLSDGHTLCSIQSFSPYFGYIGAVAVQRAEYCVRILDWLPDSVSFAP